jgi:hypothetical protein
LFRSFAEQSLRPLRHDIFLPDIPYTAYIFVCRRASLRAPVASLRAVLEVVKEIFHWPQVIVRSEKHEMLVIVRRHEHPVLAARPFGHQCRGIHFGMNKFRISDLYDAGQGQTHLVDEFRFGSRPGFVMTTFMP